MNPEEQLHRAVADYLRVALQPPTIWTTFPAGGGGRVRGAKLKAMGMQPGWPDILIMWPDDNGPRVLGIELKGGKGRLSPAQREMFMAFTGAFCTYVVCRSVDDVAKSLSGFDVPHRATAGLRMARAA